MNSTANSLRRGIANACALAFVAVFVASCNQHVDPPPPPLEPLLPPHERSLDHAAQYLEEYGTVVLSAPILSRPDERFAVGLDKTAKDLFDDARVVQGAAANNDERLFSLTLGASVQVDPTKAAAFKDALTDYKASEAARADLMAEKNERARQKLHAALELAKTETDTAARAKAEDAAWTNYFSEREANLPSVATRPELSDKNTPTQTDAGADAMAAKTAAALGGESFANPRTLLPTTPDKFAISSRNAMITAAGDRAIQGVLNLFGDPGKAQELVGRDVFFGAAVVSVLPGWRSRQGFAAQLAVHVETVYDDAKVEDFVRLATDPRLPLSLRLIIASRLPREKQATALGSFTDEQRKLLELPEVKKPERGTDPKKYDELLSEYNEARSSPSQLQPSKVEAAWKQLSDAVTQTNEGASVRSSDWVRSQTQAGKNYADLTALLDAFKSQPRRNATVTAISPLTEAQNLDTASSWRRRTELGLALAGAYQAAGQGAQAKLMTEYVRKLESDVATRGPDIAVTTYAAVGGLFGYQIGPALRGLADPSDPKSRAAYVLQRQSFPVLLLIGLEQVDSQPLVVVDVTVRRVEVLLPQFRLTSTARWMPLTSQNYRFNELQRLNVAYELGEAEGYFDGHNGAADKVGLMHTRELMHLVNGAVVTITMPAPLPEPPKPGVPTGVKLNPASVTLDRGSDGNPVSRKVSFVITGKDLTKSTAATLKIAPERIVTFSTPESLKGAITVEADVTGADGPLVFTAATSDEADAPRFLLGAVPVTINQPGYVTYTETGPGKDAVVTRKLEVDGTPPAAFLNATNSLIAGKSSGASDQNTSSTPTGGSASIKLDVQASQPDKK